MYGRGKKLSKWKNQNIRNSFMLKNNNNNKKLKIEYLKKFGHFLKQKKKKKDRKKLEKKNKLTID